jgi:hypothetical protein
MLKNADLMGFFAGLHIEGGVWKGNIFAIMQIIRWQ